MAIKKLLVPLLESPEDRTTILHAVEIARALGAHVTVMFSGGYLSELVSAEPPVHGRVKPKLQIEARALLQEQTETARRTFEALAHDGGLTVSDTATGKDAGTLHFEVYRGPVEATVQEAAVFHDIVVFHRTVSAAAEASGLSVVKSALQSCGRPVLILPEKLPAPFASSVAIAWNGSIEGAHAVSASLPLLSAAKSVHVLTVGTQKTSIDQAAKLESYLAWHGVRARVITPAWTEESVGATLLEAADAAGANLLVSGGYTHSRVRQTILGGVTHHLVSHAGVPVLLSR